MGSLVQLKNAGWLNPPPTWHLGHDALEFATGDKTDFWRDTLYAFRRDSGHAFLVPIQGDFTAYLTFEGTYETLYDQAGLMLRLDETVWLKAGIEYSDNVPNMSVVVTRGKSDWSTVALPSASGPQRLRLTRTGGDVILQFRNDDRRWQLLRVAEFSDARELLIGPMACSPERAGFKARFTEFTIGPAVAQALHDETPA